MTLPFPSPTVPISSRAEVFLGYLDYYRSVIVAKVDGLDDHALRQSRLPSGWTPIELVKHLAHVEIRWFVWGFEGEDVDNPWGDNRDGRWFVGDDETLPELVQLLLSAGDRTRAIVEAHDLADVGVPGERWDGDPPATLERVLFHVLQEYARHAGHLDIVRELTDGTVGE